MKELENNENQMQTALDKKKQEIEKLETVNLKKI